MSQLFDDLAYALSDQKREADADEAFLESKRQRELDEKRFLIEYFGDQENIDNLLDNVDKLSEIVKFLECEADDYFVDYEAERKDRRDRLAAGELH